MKEFYTHDGFTDCFLQVKHFKETYVFARWFVQGVKGYWFVDDWQIIPMSKEKQSEFKKYEPKGMLIY